MSFRLEFELRIPVCCWLISRGLVPVLECASLGNCDIIGVRFDPSNKRRLVEMIAVELKMHAIGEVIQQCQSHQKRFSYRAQHATHCSGITEIWAAMPADRAERTRDRFERLKIGLLAVQDNKQCHPIVMPPQEPSDLSRWDRAMYHRREEYLWRMTDPLCRRFHVPSETIRHVKQQGKQ